MPLTLILIDDDETDGDGKRSGRVVLVVTQDGKFDVCLDDDKACHSCFLFLRMTNLTFISFSAWQSNRLDLFYRRDQYGL